MSAPLPRSRLLPSPNHRARKQRIPLSVATVRRLALRGDGAVLSSLLQQAALLISGIGSAWLIGDTGRGQLAYGMTISSVAGICAVGGWAPAATLGVAGQWGAGATVVDLLRPIALRRALLSVVLAGIGMVPFVGKLDGALVPILVGTVASAVGVVALQFLVGIAQGQGRATWANILKSGISLSFAIPILVLAVVKFVFEGEVSIGAVAWAWAASWVLPIAFAGRLARLDGHRDPSSHASERALVRSLRSYARATFLGSIALFELLRVDVLVGMVYLTTAGLGDYVMASSFTGLLKALGQAFGVSMLSVVARTRGAEQVRPRLRRYCLVITAVAVVEAIAMWPVFEWVLPVEFRSSLLAAVVLVAAAAVTAVRRVLVEYAKGANRPVGGSIAEGVFVVVLVVMLAPGGIPKSANGLAVATALACFAALLASIVSAVRAAGALAVRSVVLVNDPSVSRGTDKMATADLDETVGRQNRTME